MNSPSSSFEDTKQQNEENDRNNKPRNQLSITFFLREPSDIPLSHSNHHHLLGGLELKEAPDGILVLQREEYQLEGLIPPFQYARLECIHFHPRDDDASVMIHIPPSTGSQLLLEGIVEKLFATKNGFVTLKLGDMHEDKSHEQPQDTEPAFNYNQALVINPHKEPDLDLGIQFTSITENDESPGRLMIQAIHPSSWLYNSCLEPGQLVLGINGSECMDVSPENAEILLQCKKEASPVINIQTLPLQAAASSSPQRRGSRIKRMAVAVTGSTMVGVGSVLFVTPLHPVGHAMALGGVGVLATEFKGPRNAWNKMKRRISSDGSAPKADRGSV